MGLKDQLKAKIAYRFEKPRTLEDKLLAQTRAKVEPVVVFINCYDETNDIEFVSHATCLVGCEFGSKASDFKIPEDNKIDFALIPGGRARSYLEFITSKISIEHCSSKPIQSEAHTLIEGEAVCHEAREEEREMILAPFSGNDRMFNGIDHCSNKDNQLMSLSLVGEEKCYKDSELRGIENKKMVLDPQLENERISGMSTPGRESEECNSPIKVINPNKETIQQDDRTDEEKNRDILSVALELMKLSSTDQNTVENRTEIIDMMNMINSVIENDITDEEKGEFLELLIVPELGQKHPVFAIFKENLIHLLTDGKGLEDLSDDVHSLSPPPPPTPKSDEKIRLLNADHEHPLIGEENSPLPSPELEPDSLNYALEIELASIQNTVNQIFDSNNATFSERELKSIISLINNPEKNIKLRCGTIKMLSKLKSPRVVMLLDELILNSNQEIRDAAKEALSSFNPKILTRIRTRINELRAEEERGNESSYPIIEEGELIAANEQPGGAEEAAE